jgi:hypothetical protein
MAGAMLAAARCLRARRIDLYLRPLLWDVFSSLSCSSTSSSSRDPDSVYRSASVAVDAIESRLQGELVHILYMLVFRIADMASVESGHGAVEKAINEAKSSERLAQMDPRYHPWF